MCGLSCKAEQQLIPLPRAAMIESSSGATNKQIHHRLHPRSSVLTSARTPLFAIMISKITIRLQYKRHKLSCFATFCHFRFCGRSVVLTEILIHVTRMSREHSGCGVCHSAEPRPEPGNGNSSLPEVRSSMNSKACDKIPRVDHDCHLLRPSSQTSE